MDAIIVKNKVSLLEQVHPTNLPCQTRNLHKDPLFQRARGFDKGDATCQSAESIFCSSALLTNSYFYPSCNQNYLRKVLLITAKVVSLRVEQNNNSNC